MMDRTDRHFRYLCRLISPGAWLYTEMITTGALLHGPRARLLAHDPAEHPVAIQLGGNDPAALAECAVMAEEAGYCEVNLNCGCPSDRVQGGNFGVCLMGEPQRVADCVAAMVARVKVPVTVKHRIGFDDRDRYEDMLHFVDTVAAAGCQTFSVHARKAWLQGLSPKENREIPPLRYDDVYRLKLERPHLEIELNGGLKTVEQCREVLAHVDGVMIGRQAWEEPWLLAELGQALLGETPPDRIEVIRAFLAYADRVGEPLRFVVRGLHGLFAGQPGARRWRQALATARSTRELESALPAAG